MTEFRDIKFECMFDELINEFDKYKNNRCLGIIELSKKFIEVYNALIEYYKPDEVTIDDLINDAVYKTLYDDGDDWHISAIYNALSFKTVGQMFYFVCEQQQTEYEKENIFYHEDVYSEIFYDLAKYCGDEADRHTIKQYNFIKTVQTVFKAIFSPKNSIFSQIEYDLIEEGGDNEIFEYLINNIDSVINEYENIINTAITKEEGE